MFIRTKKRANGKIAVQIVETIRRGKTVNQKVIRHIGQGCTEEEVEALKDLAKMVMNNIKLERQPLLPFFSPEDLTRGKKLKKENQDNEKKLTVELDNIREEQRVITGIKDIFENLFNELNNGKLIKGGRKTEQWNKILCDCVLARIANPQSKKRTASLLERDYGIKISLEKIYRMMDHLAAEESSIKKIIASQTRSLLGQKVNVLFFDVTTLYFESFEPDGLREFGFSKDNKFKETQITLALVATTEGLPITYKIFPGNTCEGKTLLDMAEELKSDYNINEILIVADRAMFTKANLETMDKLGIKYIVAAKLKSLPKNIKEEILSENYSLEEIKAKEKISFLCKEYEYNNRRLIVSYNEKRANKDKEDRKRLIERLLKKVKNGRVKLGDLIQNRGSKKYIKIRQDEAVVNEEKIQEDALWDGLHGIITNCKTKSAKELLDRYASLWQIEAAFRISKHDLKMRPIYHWTEPRIKAHICLCFIAYSLIKQALYRLKTIKQISLSFEQLREELLHVQASIVTDIKTNRFYVIPSQYTVMQGKIYQAFGLKRNTVPYELLKK